MLTAIHQVVWSPVTLALIVGVALFYTIYLKGVQFCHLKTCLHFLFKTPKSSSEGSLSPVQALMTAMAGIVGVGNIAGVATAMTTGGVGALFWMWVVGVLGMATSFAENTLSLRYRMHYGDGSVAGGPMFYITHALKWRFFGGLFAVFCLASSLGLGNFVQAHSVADGMQKLFQVPPLFSGIALALAVGVVLIGGVKRIGKVASFCVPIMGAVYCAAGLSVVLFYWRDIPSAFGLIFSEAFSPKAAAGGALGGTIMLALRSGIARGIFSSEAGLGSAPIASAEAKVPLPAYQGIVSMAGTFLSTCLVCTITGLVILLTGALESESLKGACLTIAAFEKKLFFGGWVVGIALLMFGYSTALGWAFYGERCLLYLFGSRAIKPYRLLFCMLLVVGALCSIDFVWLYADIANGLMALPNLLALLVLAKEVKTELSMIHKRT